MKRTAKIGVGMLLVAMAALCFSAVTVRADEVSDLLDNVQQTYETVNDFTSDLAVNVDFTMESPMPSGETVEQSMKMTVDGNVQFKKPEMMRMQMEMEMIMDMMGGQSGQEAPAMVFNILTVSDGSVMWMDMQSAFGNQVIKYDLEEMKEMGQDMSQTEMFTQDFSEAIAELREMMDFAITGTETVDGIEMTVLEATPNKKFFDKMAESNAGNPMNPMDEGLLEEMFSKVKVYIGSEDYLVYKAVVIDSDGGEFMTFAMSNVETNTGLSDDIFQYEPTGDYIDYSEMMQGMQGMPMDDEYEEDEDFEDWE